LKSILNSANEKKPLINGFFSFIIIAFLNLFLIQLLSRAIIYAINFSDKLSLTHLLQCEFYGAKQDVSIVAYFLMLLLLILIVLTIFKCAHTKQIAVGYFTIVSLLISLITIIDSQLLNNWNNKTDFQFFFYLKYPQEALNTVPLFWWITSLVILIGLTIVSYKWFQFAFRKFSNNSITISWKSISPVIIVLAVLIRGGLGIMPLLISDASFSDNRNKNLLATNSVWNFFYQMGESSGLTEVEDFRNQKYLNSNLDKLYFKDSEFVAPIVYWDKAPNVVLIVLEGFTAELSNFFGGHDGDCMPFIDSLARNGYACKQMFASGDRTDKGLLSILSGWPGQTWQNMINHPSKFNKLPALASQFSNLRGYQTSFYYGGNLDFANMKVYLKNNGFENLKGEESISKFTKQTKGKWGYSDEILFDYLANQNLLNEDKPIFSTMLTLSSHEPYDIAPAGLVSVKEKMKYCVKYTDNQLKKYFNKVRKNKNFNNTIFVITADHGKQLNTIETLYGSRNFFHIPFLIYGNPLPAKFKGYVNNQVVSQSDIYQSLHELILQRPDKNALFSRNVFRNNHPQNAICNLTGATVYIDSLSCTFLPTDKMSISKKANLTKLDSLLLHLQTKIIQNFLK
jgi:phosphoglycerol transferase MdoB-like AlkP superfamily enzyme